MAPARTGLDRRSFLQVSAAAGGGLLIGFHLLGCGGKRPPAHPDTVSAATPVAGTGPTPPPATGSELNAWLLIGADDQVTVRVHSSEMGQGVLTSFAQILADELHADWAKVRSEHGPVDPRYGNQLTGGSNSIRRNYARLREAGAAAREMLIAAAAAHLGVDAAGCRADNHQVVAGDGRSVRFGEVAAAAAALTAPEHPALTDDAQLKYIGKPMPRLDTPAKVDGSAVFGVDVTLPGMRVAVVARCPVFGGKLRRFSATRAKKVPGVRDVVEIKTGVAVIADHTWAAIQGREALDIEWDDGAGAELSSALIRERSAAALARAAVARDDGDAPGRLRKAGRKLEAIYEVPYLAHAAMEPLGATARIADGRCEVWASTQAQGECRKLAAQLAGVSEDNVAVHTTMLGGGFGRRAQINFVAEAVDLAARTGTPIKVQWTREDDVTGGFYRPCAYNRMVAALDAGGAPVAWQHEIASPAILSMFGPLAGGIDRTAVEGAENLLYAIPAIRVTYANVELPIPTFFWRSVGSSQNGFATECFLDELARAGKKDPVALRRSLLAGKPRHLAVLDKAAGAAGWGTPLPPGRARGVAIQEAFGTIVAQVAEVSIEGGKPRVHKVTCAVDCGQVVNPDTVAAQMESGIGFGLSAALFGEITIAKGRAEQSNFDDYPVVRMKHMPAVDVHIVASGAPLGGIGEPGVPPIAPAVCNALLALTGVPIRRLPIRLA